MLRLDGADHLTHGGIRNPGGLIQAAGIDRKPIGLRRLRVIQSVAGIVDQQVVALVQAVPVGRERRDDFVAGRFLKQVDFDGSFQYSSVVEAAVAIPTQFLIEAAYPNPFNPTTTIRFAVASEQHVEVTLVNAAGQSIRSLLSGTVAANEMQQIAIDASGLPSGTYLVHFEGNGLSASERIILMK